MGDWAEFCEIWWEDYRDKEVRTDYLFNLASRHKLFQDLWGGRDEHAARTAFGKDMANMRDRVIGRPEDTAYRDRFSHQGVVVSP